MTHYLIDIVFDESAKAISGSVQVTATSLVDGLSQVALNMTSNMNVFLVTQGFPSSYNFV